MTNSDIIEKMARAELKWNAGHLDKEVQDAIWETDKHQLRSKAKAALACVLEELTGIEHLLQNFDNAVGSVSFSRKWANCEGTEYRYIPTATFKLALAKLKELKEAV